MSKELGEYLRHRRIEKQQKEGNAFSLRQLATRIGIEPSYLSKIERGLEPRPSEETTKALAKELGEDSDALLAMAGKVSNPLPPGFGSFPLRHIDDHAERVPAPWLKRGGALLPM